jgi:KEOPS complex subunit Cgi121
MAGPRIIGAVGRINNLEHAVGVLQQLESGEALALNADLVCGREHLETAAEHAARAFERGSNVSTAMTMEIMLYASGERQIARARDKIGLKRETERLAILLLGAEENEVLTALGLRRDDSVLNASAEKAERFGISQAELEAADDPAGTDVVLERVAFVDIQKR